MGTVAMLVGIGCRSPEPVSIRAGLLLDGRSGQQRDAVITVVGDRIRAITPYRGGPVTHDLSRYTVLPGLIDAHVHISGYINAQGRVHTGDDGETAAQGDAARDANAWATLRAGFTTVASMGSDLDKALRERIARGAVPGPRILTSLDPFLDSSLSPGALRRLVRYDKAHGADFIKIFNSGSIRAAEGAVFSAEQLAALCGEARQVKLRSVVHAQSDASVRAAAVAGCDEVEHGMVASPEALSFLAERGIYFDPQCGLVLRNYLEHRSWFDRAGFDSNSFAFMERRLPTLPGVIRTASAIPGLHLLFGSDAIAGAHGRNGEDLVCRVREAGLSPMEVLVTASSHNAAALGLGREVGTLAPGYQADVVAIDGDPLREIEAVLRVKFVMKEGRVYVNR